MQPFPKYTQIHGPEQKSPPRPLLLTDPEPHRGPKIAAARSARFRGLVSLDDTTDLSGLGKDGAPVKPLLIVCDLADLFEHDEGDDVHVVVYVVEKNSEPVERQPRLNKDSLSGLRAAGFEVLCHSVWIDLDLKDILKGKPPGKVKWTELTKSEADHVWTLVEQAHEHLSAKGMSWGAYYTTQSGLRFVHPLALPVPAGDGYEALLARFHAAYNLAGLPVDEACRDWTRLYRAPRVTKADGTETWRADWFSFRTDFDDDTTFYVPTEGDLTPGANKPVARVVAVKRERPTPEQARALVEVINPSNNRWQLTVLGKRAKEALKDSVPFDVIYNRLPIAREGKRHDMLTRIVGTVVGTLHGLPGMTPELVYGLLYDAAGRLGEDEDWTGKVWEMATSFWDRETAKKAQTGAAETSTTAVDLDALPEPTGKNAAEWLAFMNSRHAVIKKLGGKCRVVSWEREKDRDVLCVQSYEDVRKGYANRSVRISTVKDGEDEATFRCHEVGRWWFLHPDRRQFERVVFSPNEPPELEGNLNLWKGWGVLPAPGDWSLMRRHVVEVLAAGNVQHADYILRWLAWTVQNPATVPEVALGFRGGEGTGKGTLGRAMKKIFGQHGVQISSGAELTGRFNAHLRDCAFLFADEAMVPEDRDAVGRLKAMVTEPTIRVEQKGIDSQEIQNCLHIMMATNEHWFVPAGHDARRYAIFDVSESRKGDRAWFEAVNQQLESGGLAAMLHELLAMPLGKWHPRQDRPQTDALADQKAQSLRGVDRLWFDCLHAGELPVGTLLPGGDVRVATGQLLEGLRRIDNGYGVNAKTLGALLFQVMSCEDKRPGGKARLAIIPALAEARRRWDAKRFPFHWPAADGWSVA